MSQFLDFSLKNGDVGYAWACIETKILPWKGMNIHLPDISRYPDILRGKGLWPIAICQMESKLGCAIRKSTDLFCLPTISTSKIPRKPWAFRASHRKRGSDFFPAFEPFGGNKAWMILLQKFRYWGKMGTFLELKELKMTYFPPCGYHSPTMYCNGLEQSCFGKWKCWWLRINFESSRFAQRAARTLGKQLEPGMHTYYMHILYIYSPTYIYIYIYTWVYINSKKSYYTYIYRYVAIGIDIDI